MRALSIRAFGAASGVLLSGLLAGTARSADDGPLTRSPSNPLLSRGPSGSFDQIKIGPRAILDEGPSDWKMWYEGVPAGNQSVAGYATSTDGLTWTKYAGNPVMTPTQTWEGVGGTNHETSPSTVLKKGGVYKMWYHGIEGTTRRIGYATSSDGITWTHYAGNPVLDVGANGEWDAGGIGEPKVIHVGSTYLMYYVHTVDPGGVGLATSADGVTWTKYAGNPVLQAGASGAWDDGALQGTDVVFDGTSYHAWYSGRKTSYVGGLGYASSSDGKAWAKGSRNPVLVKPTTALGRGDDYGFDSGINAKRVGSDWWIFYCGMAFCCPENETVDLATVSATTIGDSGAAGSGGRGGAGTGGTSGASGSGGRSSSAGSGGADASVTDTGGIASSGGMATSSSADGSRVATGGGAEVPGGSATGRRFIPVDAGFGGSGGARDAAGGTSAANQDSGCGCRMARSNPPSLPAFLGFGMLAVLRSRRRGCAPNRVPSRDGLRSS